MGRRALQRLTATEPVYISGDRNGRAELLTRVDPTRLEPAIDPTATPAKGFWSATETASALDTAWVVLAAGVTGE